MGISSLERRVSPENPSTSLSNPAPWLSEALGAGPTHSGVAVSERTALSYAAAYACINVLSKDIAQLPIFVYQRDGDERNAVRDHRVWKLLHDRPNPFMTPFTFKQTMQAHAVSWGNGYAEIEVNGAAEPVALWPLLPDRTKVQIRDGKKWIVTKVRESDGSERWVGLPSEKVLHFMGLGFDGITGYSVIQMARNAIGAGMAAEEYSARLYSNGASPRVALKTPNKLTDDARTNLKLSWDAAYGGLANAHRTAVLEEGLEVEKIGLPAKDQQMIESSQFSIEQMARFFDIPLMRLHSTTAITSWGTGLEQWQRAYLVHTLGPWLVQWEETLNYGLFAEEERATYFAEFLREALLQGDMAAQGTWFTQMFGVGAMSPNQIARKLNMPSLGPEGDKRFIPLNFIPLEDAGRSMELPDPAEPGPTPPTDDPEGEEEERARPTTERATVPPRQLRTAQQRQRMQGVYGRVYQQAADRVVAKHVAATRRAVERLEKDGNIPAFQDWVRTFFESERDFIAAAFLPTTLSLAELVSAAALAEIGSKREITREVESFVTKYVEAMSRRESESSVKQLLAITNDPDATGGTEAQRLTQRLDGWTETRAKQIAAREPVQAANAVSRQVYEEAGVRTLMWVTVSESCPFCTSMHGKAVSVERPFVNAGDSVGSGDSWLKTSFNIGHPPLHKGCDCVIVAA